MAFVKRLGYYLFGLAIGLIFLAIFLKNKAEGTGAEFCYLPNCRTLKDIRTKQITYSESLSQRIQSNELDSLDIVRLLHDGDVDFGRSDTRSAPCKTYVVTGIVQGRKAELKVRNCEEEALMEGLSYP